MSDGQTISDKEAETSVSLAKPRVLLAIDNSRNHHRLVKFLVSKGIPCNISDDVAVLKQYLDQYWYPVIVCQTMLYQGTGKKLIAYARSVLPSTEVIWLSHYSTYERDLTILDGIDHSQHYLNPIEHQELYRCIYPRCAQVAKQVSKVFRQLQRLRDSDKPPVLLIDLVLGRYLTSSSTQSSDDTSVIRANITKVRKDIANLLKHDYYLVATEDINAASVALRHHLFQVAMIHLNQCTVTDQLVQQLTHIKRAFPHLQIIIIAELEHIPSYMRLLDSKVIFRYLPTPIRAHLFKLSVDRAFQSNFESSNQDLPQINTSLP